MCFERRGTGSEVREGYIDKVIIELRPEALVELGKHSWEHCCPNSKESMCKGPGLTKA